MECSVKEDKESTSFCHINRKHVVRNLLRHLCSVGTDHIFVVRPKVSIFKESVITHARKPHGIWSHNPQWLMKPAAGNSMITSIICFNDGQVIHIVQFFFFLSACQVAARSCLEARNDVGILAKGKKAPAFCWCFRSTST